MNVGADAVAPGQPKETLAESAAWFRLLSQRRGS